LLAVLFVGYCPTEVVSSSGFTACSDRFADGFIPTFTDKSKPTNSVQLCDSRGKFYATLYDGDLSVPAWSAYVTEPSDSTVPRKDAWHDDTDPALTNLEQQLVDAHYWPTGYDRGHLCPNAAMATSAESALSTFVTTNIAAQLSTFNRGSWSSHEQDIRKRANAVQRSLYVVTGVAFIDRNAPTVIPGKANLPNGDKPFNFSLPDYYYSAVCDPTSKESLGYFGRNSGTTADATESMSRTWAVSVLEEKFGITLLHADACNTHKLANWAEFPNSPTSSSEDTTSRLRSFALFSAIPANQPTATPPETDGCSGEDCTSKQTNKRAAHRVDVPTHPHNEADDAEVDRCTVEDGPESGPEPALPEACDFIIVGGGTGGLVVAKRLAEVKEWTICVMDRGQQEINWKDGLFNFGKNKWGGWSKGPAPFEFVSPNDPNWFSTPQLSTNPKRPQDDGKLIYVPRFRGIGGTARIYGAIAVRPHPELLENRWPKGWQEEDLRPYYRHLEDHVCFHPADGSEPSEDCKRYHGNGGPMPINTLYEPEFQPFSNRFTELCNDSSTMWKQRVEDYNGKPDDYTGCSIFQQYTVRQDARANPQASTARASSFTGYLKCNHVPKQSNLKIFLDSPVTKIEFDKNKRAIGVTILRGGTTTFIGASKEVVLAGGAYDTPQILQVSGVGNRTHLESIGVDVVAENNRVGEDLWDHISVPYVLQYNEEELKKAINEHPPPEGRSSNGPFSWILQFSTGTFKNDLKNIRDMQIYFMDNSPMFSATDTVCRPASAGTENITQLRLIHQHPSYRGSVKATSPSIFDKAQLDMNWKYPMPADDFDVFEKTIEHLRKLLFEDKNGWGALVEKELKPGFDPTNKERSKEMLKEYLRTAMVSALHPACTCRMGTDAATSCSDGNLRVRGVSGLRVSDASAFATQVDGNPTQMILTLAEKLADMLKVEWLGSHATFLWQQETRELTDQEVVALANLPGTVSLGNGQNYSFTEITKDSSGGFSANLKNAGTYGLKEAKFRSTIVAAPYSAWKMSFQVITDGKSEVNIEKIADEFNARFSRIFNNQYAVIKPEAVLVPSPESDLPLYVEATAAPTESTHGSRPGSAERPRVFVCWRQNFAAVPLDTLWGVAGAWKGALEDGTPSTFPGSTHSFQLPGLPVMTEYVVWFAKNLRAFVYRMARSEPPGQPGVDYISTKKTVAFGPIGSAWIRSGSLLIDEANATNAMGAADAILFDVYMSGGRRFEPKVFWDLLPGHNMLVRFAENGNDVADGEGTAILKGRKTAAFDLDNTLIRTKSGSVFAKDKDDWTWMSPSTPAKLQSLYKQGYNIAILSNQRGILMQADRGHEDASTQWTEKVDSLLKELAIPVTVIAALDTSSAKPETEMWDAYIKYADPSANKALSWYCGDAAGRIGDFAATDKDFANKVGLGSFKTPEDFYGSDFEMRHWDVEEIQATNMTCPAAWKLVGNFWNLPNWVPTISETTKNQTTPKKVRKVVFPGQPPTFEMEIMRTATSYTYKWVSGPWGERFQKYLSQISVHKVSDGCVVQWTGSFEHFDDSPVRQFYRSGLDCIAKLGDGVTC
jgi:choline dehydrogenase